MSAPDSKQTIVERLREASGDLLRPLDQLVLEAADLIDSYRARLELDHCYQLVDGETVRVELADDTMPDGIECRDETIKRLEANVSSLQSQYERDTKQLERLWAHTKASDSRANSLLALVGEAETALTTISNGEGYIHDMTLDEVDAIILKLKAALHG